MKINVHLLCAMGFVFFLLSCASTVITPVGNLSFEPHLSPVVGLDSGQDGLGVGFGTSLFVTGQNMYPNTDQNLKNLSEVAENFAPEEEEAEGNISLIADAEVSEPEKLLVPDSNQSLWKQNELTLLAMCIYGEARSEPLQGKLAVGYVAMNRLEERSWYGRNLREVLLKPLQFSCFNKNDPNYRKMFKPRSSEWKQCFKAAWNVYSKLSEDPTEGANHYCLHTITPPWIKRMEQKGQIGAHIFYRANQTAMTEQWLAYANASDKTSFLGDPQWERELHKYGVLILSSKTGLPGWNRQTRSPQFEAHVRHVNSIINEEKAFHLLGL